MIPNFVKAWVCGWGPSNDKLGHLGTPHLLDRCENGLHELAGFLGFQNWGQHLDGSGALLVKRGLQVWLVVLRLLEQQIGTR